MPSSASNRAGVKSRSESHRVRQLSPTRSLASRIDETPPSPREVVPDRQSRLPAADDDGLDALGLICTAHNPQPPFACDVVVVSTTPSR